MEQNKRPRKPTKAELKQLFDFMVKRGTLDKDDPGFMDFAFIAVFDDYITLGPGYFGKAFMIVWGSGPMYYELYTIENGRIHFKAQDSCMRQLG